MELSNVGVIVSPPEVVMPLAGTTRNLSGHAQDSSPTLAIDSPSIRDDAIRRRAPVCIQDSMLACTRTRNILHALGDSR